MSMDLFQFQKGYANHDFFKNKHKYVYLIRYTKKYKNNKAEM